MQYHQITPEERYTLAAHRAQQPRLSNAEIARRMERHASTISRELPVLTLRVSATFLHNAAG
ncbi:MAG: hypothetical protein DMF56_14330 [Acidobacteria bacterium]|nr:MAG: hypothetical protein DMF56_14330 [Acidobacteriota bacterium]